MDNPTGRAASGPVIAPPMPRGYGTALVGGLVGTLAVGAPAAVVFNALWRPTDDLAPWALGMVAVLGVIAASLVGASVGTAVALYHARLAKAANTGAVVFALHVVSVVLAAALGAWVFQAFVLALPLLPVMARWLVVHR